MESARPLRDVFAGLGEGADDLVGGPGGVLSASGHSNLPEPLVAEAVVSYADTAPHEVAEHLAPFVQAFSAVPLPAPDGAPDPDWFGLLATAPRVTDPAPAVLDTAYGYGDTGEHSNIEIDDHNPVLIEAWSVELPEPTVDPGPDADVAGQGDVDVDELPGDLDDA
jgi:hypothetical protein